MTELKVKQGLPFAWLQHQDCNRPANILCLVLVSPQQWREWDWVSFIASLCTDVFLVAAHDVQAACGKSTLAGAMRDWPSCHVSIQHADH